MTVTEIAKPLEAKLVRANGIDVAYRVVGDGPPLVLLHGGLASTGPAWTGSPVSHVDHLATLGRHFRVIAPDTRGSGATVNSGGAATFDVLVDDVLGLVEALGLDRPLLAGFSEGGATATSVALARPDAVRAVVNHSGFDYFDPHAPMMQSIRPMFGGSPDATAADPDAAAQALQSSPEMATVLATMKADYDGAQGEGHWRTYLEMFFDRHVSPFGYTIDDLAGIGVPTLILTGDRDPFCSVEAACVAFRTIEQGELGIVANTGHEITGPIVDSMIAFLARHAFVA